MACVTPRAPCPTIPASISIPQCQRVLAIHRAYILFLMPARDSTRMSESTCSRGTRGHLTRGRARAPCRSQRRTWSAWHLRSSLVVVGVSSRSCPCPCPVNTTDTMTSRTTRCPSSRRTTRSLACCTCTPGLGCPCGTQPSIHEN